MALPFRHQIFAWLVAIALIPASFAVLVWLYSPQIAEPAGGVEAWERAADSWRVARHYLDLDSVAPETAAALGRHEEELSNSVRMASRTTYVRNNALPRLAVFTVVIAVVLVGGAIRLAGHLSRQLSRPIDELVSWTGLVRRGETLPQDPPVKGAPEFATLRGSFREMAGELMRAREREIEATRLRTFRDMARQVAHELKNPLTSILFALDRLEQNATPQQKELLTLLESESKRLEGMARDFSALGRLPEGPTAPIDMGELLDTLAGTAPEGVAARVEKDAGAPLVRGHYEPLRRAFQNLFINACHAIQEARGPDAMTPRRDGEIVMAVRGVANGSGRAVEVVVRDNGVGMDPVTATRLFEPYYTTKEHGTGLGLTLVRQTVQDHGGTITVASEPGRGATFTVTLPAEQA